MHGRLLWAQPEVLNKGAVEFQAIITNKLSYASPACRWWFTSADDRNRLETFLRRSAKLCYSANSSATVVSICADADHQLFTRLSRNSQHLPPEREQHYSLRDRSHNYQLPDRISTLNDINFVVRISGATTRGTGRTSPPNFLTAG